MSDHLPQPPPVKLDPRTRCLMVMEWKCRKCGEAVVGATQLTVVPTKEQEEAFAVEAFKKDPYRIHACRNLFEGFTGMAPLVGVWFKFAISTATGHSSGNGTLIVPPGRN